jgi:hypothetical protein
MESQPCGGVISATQKVEVEGSWSEASLGKSKRLYLKNKLKTQGLMHASTDTMHSYPSKSHAQSSTPRTTGKKKTQNFIWKIHTYHST